MYFNYKYNNEKNALVKNYYTQSKIESEKLASSINSIVLRTNFFGKSLSRNRISFSDWIYINLKKKKFFSLADDLFFSPLSMFTLSKILLKILKINKTGVYNLGSTKGMSRYKFGVKFCNLLKLDTKLIKKVKMKDLNLYANRNNDMRMILKKFVKNFKIKLPTLENEIIKEIKNYDK